MTVYKDVAYGPGNLGLSEDEIDKRVREALETVGLGEEIYEKSPFELSGGQKRRAAIAGVLAMEPEVLILDEPTAGLDPKERVRFRNLISAFSKGRIVILSTHIVSDVEFIAEEIIMMKSGRLLHFGQPQEITAELNGQVWECVIPSSQAEQCTALYTISNLRNIEQNRTVLRVIAAQQPLEQAVQVPPTLEDLYLFYFKGGREI